MCTKYIVSKTYRSEEISHCPFLEVADIVNDLIISSHYEEAKEIQRKMFLDCIDNSFGNIIVNKYKYSSLDCDAYIVSDNSKSLVISIISTDSSVLDDFFKHKDEYIKNELISNSQSPKTISSLLARYYKNRS